MFKLTKLGFIGCLLLIVVGPMSASSREYNGVRIVHRSFHFAEAGMIRGDSLAQDLQAAGFSNASGPETRLRNLDEFAATLMTQATAEQWKSLTVDVWVGRKSASSGYYFRYRGSDANGAPVQGEAFITTDDAATKADLNKYHNLLDLNG